MPATRVYLSSVGRPLAPEDATVSVFDRGFLFGDDVFETLRTAGGRPVAWIPHLARLRRSAAVLGIAVPWSDAELRAIVDATHAATGNPDSVVRLVVTRGRGPMMLDPRRVADPLLVVYALPLALPGEDDYVRGLRARIVGVARPGARTLDPQVKAGNYLPNIQALREALAAGDDDAILLGESGAVAEGPTSNVFAVVGGAVVTPPIAEGILAGITRAIVLELAADLGAAERRLWPDDLRAADEVFLTSSVRGPIAVTTLDGAAVGAGREGPLTAAIRRRWAAYLATCAEPASSDMSEAT